MASDSHDALTVTDVNMDDLIPLVKGIMGGVGTADRTHAGAACLVVYFILSAPRPLSKQELANLMSEGSAVLLPVLINTIVNAGDYAPLNTPTKES